MAWEALPTNYTDAVWSGLKKYMMVNNEDGTVSFQDVTVYSNRENSFFGAKDANRMNEAINTIMPTWGAGENFFCGQNTPGEDNTTAIGNVVLDMVRDSPSAKLSIIGEINLNYGPIIIPDLSSSPHNNIAVTLDFSRCNLTSTNEIPSVMNLVQFSNSDKISNIHIKGLLLDHSVVPAEIIYITPKYDQSITVYIEDSTFMMGRHSTNSTKSQLITEGSGGTYPTYYFVGCTFKSNYSESNPISFRNSNIMMLFPSSTFKSFVFFERCKFLLYDDNSNIGAEASAYGGYGITNTWQDNHYFKFCGCVMAYEILFAQTNFSSIETVTNLQYYFNNSDKTSTNILFN